MSAKSKNDEIFAIIFFIAQCKREKKVLAVLMLDLDKFKPVNDSFGQRAGDKLLIKVSQRIKSLVQRETDTVARIGGNEFVIVLPIITEAQKHRMRLKFQRKFVTPLRSHF